MNNKVSQDLDVSPELWSMKYGSPLSVWAFSQLGGRGPRPSSSGLQGYTVSKHTAYSIHSVLQDALHTGNFTVIA